MAQTDNNDLDERFLRVYSNLPLAAREETIAIYKNEDTGITEPVSWQVVFFEVKNDSPRAKHFLEMLNQMKLI